MEDYIGDGIYVKFECGMIELKVTRNDRDELIYLKPETYAALKRFADKAFGIAP